MMWKKKKIKCIAVFPLQQWLH